MINDNNFTIMIPARMGSKGFPFKNRVLFDYTASSIPDKYKSVTYVSTDDDLIAEKAISVGFNYHKRSWESAKDTATSKDMVLDFVKKSKRYLITLYLTYPERTWSDVEKAISFFNSNNSESMLCKKDVMVSPYLMMFELESNKGSQVIDHNLCRRQDYKKCFEISHFISIIDTTHLSNLNNNLYSKNTHFMPIKNVVDVDIKDDLGRFKNE